MVGCGRGCHFRMQSALVEYRESPVTQCVCMQMLLPHHMTSSTVPFKEGTVPCLQPQGGFLREQEGFCTLQKQPGENTEPLELCHCCTPTPMILVRLVPITACACRCMV